MWCVSGVEGRAISHPSSKQGNVLRGPQRGIKLVKQREITDQSSTLRTVTHIQGCTQLTDQKPIRLAPYRLGFHMPIGSW